MRRCAGSHWFSVYGAPGAKTATCQRCGALHPTIARALQAGLMYAASASVPDDAPDRRQVELDRDRAILRDAVDRVGNES